MSMDELMDELNELHEKIYYAEEAVYAVRNLQNRLFGKEQEEVSLLLMQLEQKLNLYYNRLEQATGEDKEGPPF